MQPDQDRRATTPDPYAAAAAALREPARVQVTGTDPATGLVTRMTITPVHEWDGSVRWCRVDSVPVVTRGSHLAMTRSSVVTVTEAWNLAASVRRP